MNKIVMIYTYFKSDSSTFNLNYFVKNELLKNSTNHLSTSEIDYVIVINGFECDVDLSKDFGEKNVTVLRRENKGFDFGGHAHALSYLEENKKTYDFYFFMNSGVIGPILPHWFQNENHWSSIFTSKINDKVKLVGTIIACLPNWVTVGEGPIVEGFFFVTDKIGLSVIQNHKTIFYDHVTKDDAIINGEFALSRCIQKHGFTIDCMLHKYQGIDWSNKKNWYLNNQQHPSRSGWFYGKSVNPYEVIFHKWFWHNQPTVSFDIIQQHIENLSFLNNLHDNKNITYICSNKDSGGNDLQFVGRERSIDELKQIAVMNPNVVAFNTLGFLKSKLQFPLQTTGYFKPGIDFLFIVKERLTDEELKKLQ